jgi:hypothetical protein
MNFQYPTFSFILLFRGLKNTYRLTIIAFKAIWYISTTGTWRYYRSTILLIEQALEEKGEKLTKTARKRFLVYSIVGVVMFNTALRTLTGKKLTKKQQLISQYFTILTPIIDDLCDEYDYTATELKLVCQAQPQRKDNVWEHIAIMLGTRIQDLNNGKPLWQPLTAKIIDYQILSKAQMFGTIDENTLRDITYNKGGVSVQLNYEVIIDKEISAQESEGFFGLGVIIQLTNDIFDIFKDRNTALQTLATDCRDINDLRKEYNENIARTFDVFYQLPFKKQNIHDFLLQMLVLTSRGWVALDHLEKAQKTTNNIFSPQKYTRQQLITDMEKIKNIWRAFIYNITTIG